MWDRDETGLNSGEVVVRTPVGFVEGVVDDGENGLIGDGDEPELCVPTGLVVM